MKTNRLHPKRGSFWMRGIGDHLTVNAVNKQVGGFQNRLADHDRVAHDVGILGGFASFDFKKYAIETPQETRFPSARTPVA